MKPVLVVIGNPINHFNHSRTDVKHCLFAGIDIVHCNIKFCPYIEKICTIDQCLAKTKVI